MPGTVWQKDGNSSIWRCWCALNYTELKLSAELEVPRTVKATGPRPRQNPILEWAPDLITLVLSAYAEKAICRGVVECLKVFRAGRYDDGIACLWVGLAIIAAWIACLLSGRIEPAKAVGGCDVIPRTRNLS